MKPLIIIAAALLLASCRVDHDVSGSSSHLVDVDWVPIRAKIVDINADGIGDILCIDDLHDMWIAVNLANVAAGTDQYPPNYRELAAFDTIGRATSGNYTPVESEACLP